jgi:hypothetical protein
MEDGMPETGWKAGCRRQDRKQHATDRMAGGMPVTEWETGWETGCQRQDGRQDAGGRMGSGIPETE